MRVVMLVVVAAAASCADGTFDPAVDSGVVALAPDSLRAAFADALADAGRNWGVLTGAVADRSGAARDDALWLVLSMTHLDRLEATSQVLDDHLEWADVARERAVALSDVETYRRCVLAYRIGDEALEPWRARLRARFGSVAGSAPSVIADSVGRAVARIKVRNAEGLGEVLPPAAVLEAGSGTREEIAVAATASLRALGVPARRVRCRAVRGQSRSLSWVEWYDGSAWRPLYPDDPGATGDYARPERARADALTFVVASDGFGLTDRTAAYTPTGTVVLRLVEDGKPVVAHEDFALQVATNGRFEPLDDVFYASGDEPVRTDSNGCVSFVVGDGDYVAVAGRRRADGSVSVATVPVAVASGVVDTATLDLSSVSAETSRFVGMEYPRSPRLVPPGERGWVIVLVDDAEEPTLRMLSSVGEVVEETPGLAGVCVVMDGPEGTDIAKSSAWRYQMMKPDVEMPFVGGMPIVLLVDRGARVLWASEGVDLSIGARVRRALEQIR